MVVVGAVNVDLVVAAPRLPGPGETVVGPGMQRFGGGKGANAAVAAARAGARVSLVGAVGDDDLGASAIDELAVEGVETDDVAILADHPTGVALIVVDAAGENQIAVGAGANAAVRVGPLPVADLVLVSTEIAADAVVAAVRGATVPCVLNPAPVVDVVLDVLDAGPILTPNRSECLDLAARLGARDPGDDLVAAARRIQARTGAPVVVTLGGDGALIVDGRSPDLVAARPTPVRDTTGAGDTFNGVLAVRLAAGDPLADAVRTAVVAASLSVTRVGARAGMPTAAEIRAAG